jgi:hypothetical protein
MLEHHREWALKACDFVSAVGSQRGRITERATFGDPHARQGMKSKVIERCAVNERKRRRHRVIAGLA